MTWPMIWEICSAEEALTSASFLISSATTAKPRPASPALAASMAAFRESRLVWSEMSPMMPTMVLICSVEAPTLSTISSSCPMESTMEFMAALTSSMSERPRDATATVCCMFSLARLLRWLVSFTTSDRVVAWRASSWTPEAT